jgi:DNA-binding CsgD family transcriptional regulator
MIPNNINPNELIDSIRKIQSELYIHYTTDASLINDNYINEFSRNENSVKVVFDHVSFNILQISDNVEAIIGYSSEDIHRLNMHLVLKLFTFDHFTFIFVWLKWAITVYYKLGHLNESKQIICGVKLRHKDGRIMRAMFRYSAIEMTNSGLVKVRGTDIHHFLSINKKDIPHDILSVREKEILSLIAEGKESKEIADMLFLSSHTVDNHRRNMINKTGARDTTSLIQICRMGGII